MNGLLVIDKPAGFTSFDVVAVARKLTSQRKIGHTGTLDPNATGVLPLLLGSATKAQDILPDHDKRYEAGFKLGITTDTLDIWGEEKSRVQSSATTGEITVLLPFFTGEISQIPPMYSAVQVGGKRLYDLARQGVEIERESRRVTVYELKLKSFDENTQEGELEIFCSKGTYVRTIIDDIGQRLGCGAVMTSLDRTQACGFTKEDSITLDELRELAGSDKLAARLISPERLFERYPQLFVSEKQAFRFRNGGALDLSRTPLANKSVADGTLLRVKERGKPFIGLGIVSNNEVKVYKFF